MAVEEKNNNQNHLTEIRGKLLPARDFFERLHLPRLLLVAGVALLIALILSPRLISRVPRYNEGDFAIGNLRAPYDLSVIDEEATAEAKKQALANSRLIYEYDPGVLSRTLDRLNLAFQEMRKLFAPLEEIEKKKLKEKEKAKKLAEANITVKKALVEARPNFQTQLGVELSTDQFQLLIDQKFAEPIAQQAGSLLEMVYSRYVTFDKDEVMRVFSQEEQDGGSRIKVLVRGKQEEIKLDRPDQVISPKQAESALRDLAKKLLQTEPAALRALIVKVAVAQIKPNMVFDANNTEEARHRAVDSVLPVTYSLKKNQLIIGDGQRVERQVKVVLDYLRESSAPTGRVKTLLGLFLLSFATLLITFWLTDINTPHFVITDRDVAVLGLLLVVTLASLRFTDWFSDRLLDQFSGLPSYFVLFMFPIAAPTMLVRFLMRYEVALVFAVVMTVFTALAFQAPVHYLALALIASVVGAHTMADVSRRGQVVRGGMWVGLATMGGAYVMAILGQELSMNSMVYTPMAGMFGGVVSGVLVVGLAPFFEYVFGYMTNISLLELANYEQPLLKRIAQMAPGTFHHSITISTLGEAAAEAIGANALLVRVGAMYHDLGKSFKPQYFVENQVEKNHHDEIKTPEDSARIIMAHVIEGAKFAREENLPQAIIDFIEQHHGTRKIEYFLAMARRREAEGGAPVDEAVFTYPGPKPQSRETAILMICDIIEARSRTLEDRNEKTVREMIREMIDKLVAEGQFDECGITLGDLKHITDALVGVLVGIKHKRIAYPDQRRWGLGTRSQG